MDRHERRQVLSAQVPAGDAYRLRLLAQEQDRTVSQELRRLVRQRVREAEEIDRLAAIFRAEAGE